MSTDPKIQELLGPMRDRAVDTTGRRFKVDREKIVARMIDASMSEPETSARRLRAYAVLALAAGFAMVAAGAAYKTMHRSPVAIPAMHIDIVAVEGDVARVAPSGRTAIAPGQTAAIAPDGAIETAARAEARIKTDSGLQIELRENTRVSLGEMSGNEPRVALHLDAGAVRCVIPHLTEGHTFSVITPDAKVIDRGTIFTVSVEGSGASAHTVVQVEEGVIVVQTASGETQLTASQSWGTPAPVAPTTEQPPVASTAGASAESAARAPAASGAHRGADTQKQMRGTLEDETTLLRMGLADERKGDLRSAASAFESLLSRYPESPLAPEARAGLARVKGTLGSPP
jgi:hypothetical protein